MENSNLTGQDIYNLGWKKGNDIYIDGRRIDSRKLKQNTDVYQFIKEEDKTGTSRNIFFTSKSIQTKLWTQ